MTKLVLICRYCGKIFKLNGPNKETAIIGKGFVIHELDGGFIYHKCSSDYWRSYNQTDTGTIVEE